MSTHGAHRSSPGTVVFAAALALLTGAAATAPLAAQSGRGPDSNWAFYWENDSRPLVWTDDASSDELYTNGLRMVVGQQQAAWDVLTDRLLSVWALTLRTREPLAGYSLSFGSNLFTPRRIETVEAQTRDRPYAALLYTGFSTSVVTNPLYGRGGQRRMLQSQAGHDLELIIGATGHPAYGESVQGGFHVLKASRFPKAWDREVRSRGAINLDYTHRELVGLWDVVGGLGLDATLHGGFRVGNVQNVLRGGWTGRIGYNLTGLPAVQIPVTAANTPGAGRPELEISAHWGADYRRVGYTYYLDGARADPAHVIDREPVVTDRKFGVSVRWKSWRLTASQVKRDPEFRSDLFPDGGDELEYGSAVLSREFDGSGDDGGLGLLATLAPRFLTVGWGTGSSEYDSARRSEGVAMRAQVLWPLDGVPGAWLGRKLRGVRTGFEIAGVVREDPGPLAEPSTYADDYLRTIVAVVERRLGVYDFEGRAGIGVTLAKRQFVENFEEDVTEPITEAGLGLMLGLGYDVSLTSWASIVLDASWHHSAVAIGAEDASFVRWGAGIRLDRYDP